MATDILPPDVELPFELTAPEQQSSLDVAMKVYEIGVGLIATVPMVHQALGVYRAAFMGEEGKSYLAIKAIWSDNTYTTLHADYPTPVSQSFFCSSGAEAAIAAVTMGAACKLEGEVRAVTPQGLMGAGSVMEGFTSGLGVAGQVSSPQIEGRVIVGPPEGNVEC